MEIQVASASSIIPVLRREMRSSPGGTWALVGWDGEKMGCGKRVRTTLPHEKVHFTPQMSDDDIMFAVAAAIAKLRVGVRDELLRRQEVREKQRPKRGHAWDRASRMRQPQST
jgi:hypothetical protein